MKKGCPAKLANIWKRNEHIPMKPNSNESNIQFLSLGDMYK